MAGISALAFSSCAYDPYYSGGYGDGYGYGRSGFSTSYFVSTGSSRWAYDPYAGAYYDNNRRCYYDPYLNGYYPVGYRPRYVRGAPHPRGWSRGGSYCPPPSNIRSHSLTNYRNRSDRYRSLGRSWSGNVKVNTTGRNQSSGYGSRNQSSRYGSRDQRSSSSNWVRGSSGSSRTHGSFNGDRTNRQESISGSRGQHPSHSGRSSNSTRISGDRSGRSESGNYTPQSRGNTQSNSKQREMGSGRERGASNRSGSSNQPIPQQPSRDRSQRGGSNRSGNVANTPRSAPQSEQGNERSGGGSGREGSRRGKSEKIRGLGEG